MTTTTESFWWLAGVIAAHPSSRVEGRPRLQATIKLLQRIGLPTNYLYRRDADGMYSEDLVSDLRLLEAMRAIDEEISDPISSTYTYRVRTMPKDVLPNMRPFLGAIRHIVEFDVPTLELAAVYVSYCEDRLTDEEALSRLRKKFDQRTENRESEVLFLVNALSGGKGSMATK